MTKISLLSHKPLYLLQTGWFILIGALLRSDTRAVFDRNKMAIYFSSQAKSGGAEQSNDRARLRLSAASIFISSGH